QIFDNRIGNTGYPMPVAETASNFNEKVVMDAAIEAAQGQVRIALIESQLQDATQIMCDIYSRYLFETAVFEKKADGFLFADELKELMLAAQKEAYGDGLDHSLLHPYMWVCKGHYYSAGLNFYNFPYAFGGLFARGLYAKYKEEGEAFLPKYRALLKATPVCSVEDAARLADIDLANPEFFRKSLQSYADRIDEFLKLTEGMR
ncbi:MAG: peptidase M3, partial [Lachnospiraceae bacterium]|nr:peptidase M3 [Lachnospiraceae bacterium]